MDTDERKMTLFHALEVLAENYTRDDPEMGFTVESPCNRYSRFSTGDYS